MKTFVVKIFYPVMLPCLLFFIHTVSAQSLTVGVVQLYNRPDVAERKEVIIKFIREARSQGCDFVVFPEDALGCEDCPKDSLYIKQISSAVDEIRNASRENHIYTVLCVKNLLKPGDPYKIRLYGIDEDGQVAKIYDKLWDQKNFTLPPGTITVKGIRIGLCLCADRWIRSTTDLPLIDAPISIECSWSKPDTTYFPYGPIEGIRWWEIRKPDGTFLDSSPALGPYWIPRAIRNDAFVICAARHASIVYPDGQVYHCADKSEQLLVRKIDLTGMSRENANERFNHPAFKPWWDMGSKIIEGGTVENHEPEFFVSDPAELSIAVVQMAVSGNMNENLGFIKEKIREAKAGNADLVVFPALALTGKSITGIQQQEIERALTEVRDQARQQGIFVILGSAWKENENLFNSAFVIDREGNIATRYDQLSADNDRFTRGLSARAMWFQIKNVHAAVTVGGDLYWEEIAELAACKGAQLLVNIANDNFGKYSEYFQLAYSTFNTFTVLANAAADPGMTSTGRSRVYDDLRRPKAKYHAELVLEADAMPGLFFVKGKMESKNPWVANMKYLNKSMIPWYNYGAEVIYKE